MPVFYVTSLTNKQALKEAVKRVDGGAYELRDDSWFLKFDGTAHALSEKLGLTNGESGNGVIVPVTNYSGRAPADLWEWLRLRLAGPST